MWVTSVSTENSNSVFSGLALKQAILSLVVLFLGVIFSVFLENDEALAHGLGFTCILLALLPFFSSYRAASKRNLLTCFVCANLAPIWFLYLEGVLPGGDAREMLGPDLRIHGYIWACLYSFFYNIFYCFSLRKLAYKLNGIFPLTPPEARPSLLGTAAIVMFLLPIIIIGSRYSSLGELWDSLTKGRVGGEGMGVLLRVNSIGGDEVVYQPLMWLFQLVPTVSAMAVDSAVRIRRFSMVALVGLLFGASVVFFYFLGGSRGQFIQMIAAPAGFLIYRNLNRGWKFVAFCILAFVLLIGLMEFQVRTRGNMLEKIQKSEDLIASSSDGELTTFNPLKAHRDNNFYLSCLIIEGMPKSYPFDGFKGLWIDICNPIPRAIWPGKPMSEGAEMSKSAVSEVLNSGPLVMGTSSLSTTVVGDFYKMGGAIGLCIIAAIFAVFHSFIDCNFLINKSDNTVAIGIQAAACFFAFWGFRAFGTVITMGYSFFALLASIILLNKFKPRNPKLSLSMGTSGDR